MIIIIIAMSRKVHPEKSVTNSQLSSTSRHQLKDNKLFEAEEVVERQQQFQLSNLRLKFFVGQLAKKIKFLAPPFKKPDNVVEEWEQDLNNQTEMFQKKKPQVFRKETLTEDIINRYQPVHIFSVVQGILIILFSWTVTVSMVFQEKVFVFVPILIILVCLWELGMKTNIGWKERQEQNIYEIQWTSDFIEPFLLLVAAVLMVVRSQVDWGVVEWIVLPYQLFVVCIQWQNVGQYFDYVKLYAQQNKKRKELRIIQLFVFTLVTAHIFALIMYSMTYICPQQQETWVEKAKLTGSPWHVLYIYSYYWANTTMVTVGYGDLTPSNPIEIVVVTVIQIVGTAIFGYMINVIGITVNEIQKKNQEFEEHKGTIYKLRDHYGLSRELCFKMKSDIKKKESEMIATPLNSNEEREFLDYIGETLKEQFVLETNIRVIKKSIFFLTHFTVNFQNQIALKLIRHIYKPQEEILYKDGQHRQLVIIHSGRVNLHLVKTHLNQKLLKLARVIKPEEGKPTLNVYGYSSFILDRDVALQAVTQQTTTAYILKRKDILESMRKSILDFQSFNELREKMLQCNKVEEIQAPALKDQEYHFIPNSYLIFKKSKYEKQHRTKGDRSSRRLKMYVITLRHYQNKTMLYIPEQNKEKEEFDIQVMLQVERDNQLGNKGKGKEDSALDYLDIDQAKTFEHFLKNFNLPIIAKQYEAACVKKSYVDRARKLSRKLSHHLYKREE